MTTARSKWLACLALVTALGAVGIGIWYAPAWVRHWTAKQEAAKPADDEMEDMPGMPGMKMPKRKGTADAGSTVPGYAQVMIAPELQQRIGVKLGKVEEAPLRMSVRAVGIIRPDETKVAHVHLRTEGWVEKLFVNFTGKKVNKGDPLLAIYSPDFLATQQEYLTARQGSQKSLAGMALRRLELWGVSDQELEKLKKNGEAQENLILRSPLTGTVLEKNAFEGQRVMPKDDLYLVADLSTVWVQAKVYEYELPHVELGQPATVTVPALPERELSGKVVFIQPTLDEATRTVQVRIELPNPDGLLKPGMFAHVNIAHDMGKGLLVPTSAVIRTGERDLVFRVEPADMKGMDQAKMKDMKQGDLFVPVEVTISPVKFGDCFQVLKGLKAGDKVVTSSNFLIDSESRLRFGGGAMADMPGMKMDDTKGTDHSKMKH